ncbi:hypothetical protein YN1_7890 [Nanoarchaeota archaeon]
MEDRKKSYIDELNFYIDLAVKGEKLAVGEVESTLEKYLVEECQRKGINISSPTSGIQVLAMKAPYVLEKMIEDIITSREEVKSPYIKNSEEIDKLLIQTAYRVAMDKIEAFNRLETLKTNGVYKNLYRPNSNALYVIENDPCLRGLYNISEKIRERYGDILEKIDKQVKTLYKDTGIY